MSENQSDTAASGLKSDAGTQTGGGSGPERTTSKRVRFDEEEEEDNARASKRSVIQINSPSGKKIVHINTVDYSARPIDVVTEAWVGQNDVRYIYKLLNHRNNDGVWFPVEFVSSNATWAVVDENPLVMHRTYRGRPLLIWIVGAFGEGTLAVTRAQPRPRLRVVVDFIRERDRAAAQLLHNREASSSVKLGESLTVMSPACDNEGVPSHDQVYDARACFRGKSAIQKTSLAQIEGGDIVMVECTLVRTEGDGGSKTVAFVLNSLYWLVAKPRDPDLRVQPEMKFPVIISAAD